MRIHRQPLSVVPILHQNVEGIGLTGGIDRFWDGVDLEKHLVRPLTLD